MFYRRCARVTFCLGLPFASLAKALLLPYATTACTKVACSLRATRCLLATISVALLRLVYPASLQPAKKEFCSLEEGRRGGEETGAFSLLSRRTALSLHTPSTYLPLRCVLFSHIGFHAPPHCRPFCSAAFSGSHKQLRVLKDTY